MYALLAFLIGDLIVAIFFPIQGPWMTLAYVTIVFGLASYLFFKLRSLNRYTYDERGVHLKGRLLFQWRQVRRIGLKFDKRTGSLTLVAQPNWAAIISGPLAERETWVTYRAAMAFTLQNGEVISIPSNLDRMTRGGIIQRIDDFAKADNPTIEFE